jgi:multiple sugar transport system permease protein
MKKARLEKNYWGIIFILPFFIAYAIFSALPLITTFYYSVTDKSTFGESAEFVGFDNFYKHDTVLLTVTPIEGETRRVMVTGSSTPREIQTGADGEFIMLPFDDTEYALVRNADGTMHAVTEQYTGVFGVSVFRQAFINTPLLWLMGFIPQITIALLLAAWFTDIKVNMRGKGFFKIVFYMPNIMTAATISALFLAFVSNGGIIHQVAVALGVVDNATPLSGEWFTRGTIAFVNFWMWFGNSMIILIAGIHGINPSLFEAARIDGANSRQMFWKITVPLIKPILIFTLVQSLVGGFQMFDVPALLMGGAGTNLDLRAARTIMTTVRQLAFGTSQSLGLASAMSVILFFFTATFSILIFATMRDRSDDKIMKEHRRAEKLRYKQRKLSSFENGGQ